MCNFTCFKLSWYSFSYLWKSEHFVACFKCFSCSACVLYLQRSSRGSWLAFLSKSNKQNIHITPTSGTLDMALTNDANVHCLLYVQNAPVEKTLNFNLHLYHFTTNLVIFVTLYSSDTSFSKYLVFMSPDRWSKAKTVAIIRATHLTQLL